eukprot:CAMPEP_0118927990 /NCGR_PEP_ID=MMETSP1169-20130426/5347_1 /TAXON_ID=36882 /ORGANISM="Pyramimonas obovata, Strain CCMP722" /LENGTH=200 /DNA_ID=CAMNT_0006869877 /DNA_START=119 /DNA_END=721 /DNA_ORIENTATION=-
MEKALAAAPKNCDFKIKYLPFQLTPESTWIQLGGDVRTKGIKKRDFYDMKFGKDQWKAFMPRLEQAFAASGIENSKVDMDGCTGPTFDCHRLMLYAEDLGKEAEMCEELMRNYFTQGKTPCDKDVLVAAAEKVGLPNAEAFVAGDAKSAEVTELLKRQRQERVTGVPHFLISAEGVGRPLALGGAQPPEAFLDAFDMLAA